MHACMPDSQSIQRKEDACLVNNQRWQVSFASDIDSDRLDGNLGHAGASCLHDLTEEGAGPAQASIQFKLQTTHLKPHLSLSRMKGA